MKTAIAVSIIVIVLPLAYVLFTIITAFGAAL
jgi:hypothetical protein